MEPEVSPSAVPIGLVVPTNVLTSEELARQRAELREIVRQSTREHLSQSLVYVADALIESATPASLLLLFCSFWIFLYTTIATLLKQAATPATERFQPCITNHVLVHLAQFFALTVGAVLGSHQMTIMTLGRTNEDVQPRRLGWLLFLCAFEAIVIIPLCGPEVAPYDAATTPARCHVAQPAPLDADQEQRLSTLLVHLTFLQATYLISLAFSIFFFLALGLLAPRPIACTVPLVALFTTISVLYLQYIICFARSAQVLFVSTIAVFDKCLADAAWCVVHTLVGTNDAVTGDYDAFLKASGGIYGPRIAWSLEDVECRPIFACTLGCCIVTSLLLIFASTICAH